MSDLIVSEIFFSLNGEGLEIGKPQIFVRLSGCNLSCVWCDTKYSFDNGVKKTISGIMNEIKITSEECKSIVITGGEPLIQDINEFVDTLIENGYVITIETNGTIYDDVLTKVDFISVDIKTPSSKNETNELDTLKKTVDLISKRKGQLKAVIADLNDYKFIIDFIEKNSFKVPLVLQPCDGRMSYKGLCDLYLSNPIRYDNIRILLQLHKIGEIK